ncbi:MULTISPECIES: acetyl-CoA carboxylase biotin carboxyl carrier protein subunit [unclassified Spirosoma]|uniref:acetyl-CoA carboxylase biotin carboxyl carrier protein subunit n=1 Tax=unclassified Spirosoma TaxID=2621999 RepID=UPI00095DE02C|nr:MULTISPECIES: acetyl-CoA carboxylase biotin carboxyl carrier protein subunit [unclassified Spirosoma]MBN8821430.1 acetyl-CoA carboxylase biotin carboxyl carrier protein subunit [Spirosoma sp.]OJW78213.1 MAG: acetyl-CoA carboxylase biotin carboxyl carrier protein subunit [Spirosoma sp. 48-14]
MYTAALPDETTFTIDFMSGSPLLNGEPFTWDLAKLSDRTFHILHQNRSYNAEILDLNTTDKSVTLKINGHIHQVQLKDRFDLLLEKMGMSSAASTKVNELKAPMPGLIVGINVQPGDAINKGDSLLILEAMKMENVLKSPGAGSIKTIRVAKGDRVEKGQVLVEFS